MRSTLTSNIVNEARRRLQRRAGDVLRRDRTRTCSPAASRTSRGSTLRFPTIDSALTSPGRHPAPQSRNANSLLDRRHGDLAEGLAQLHASADPSRSTTSGPKTQTLVPSVNFDVVTNDPATALFNAANFPGASAANITAARQPVRAADRPRQLHHWRRAARTNRPASTVYLGVGLQRGRLREVGVYVQEPWRLSSQPHAQCRRALRHPAAVLSAQQPVLVRHARRRLRHLRRPRTTSCNLFQAGKTPGSDADVQAARRGHEVVQRRLQQHRAERRLGVDAGSATAGLLGNADGPRGRLRRSVAAIPRSTAGRPERLHRRLQRQSRHHDHRQPR